jgi:hypothetical protein
LGYIGIQRPFWLVCSLLSPLWVSGIHEEIALRALGHIPTVEPLCLADNIYRCYDLAFLHRILLARCMDG